MNFPLGLALLAAKTGSDYDALWANRRFRASTNSFRTGLLRIKPSPATVLVSCRCFLEFASLQISLVASMGARPSNLSRITSSLFMRPLGQVLLDLGRTTFELFGASHAKVHSLWFQRAGAATIPERRAASAGRAPLTRAHALQSRIKSRKGAVTHEPNLNAKRRMNGRRTDSSPVSGTVPVPGG